MTVTTLAAGPLRQSKIDEARRYVEQALASGREPLIAYSGGKDGLAVSLIAREFGIDVGVCEESFYFTRQRDDIHATASTLGMRVTYYDSLGHDVLLRRPHLLFPHRRPDDFNTFCGIRQRRTFEQEAHRTGRTMVLTGRKRQGNSVKAPLYLKDGLLLVHPLISWGDGDVWAWLAHNGVAVPWVYRTPFGVREGNSPWPLYRESADLRTCWRAVWETEEGIVKEAAARGIAGAAEAVAAFDV